MGNPDQQSMSFWARLRHPSTWPPKRREAIGLVFLLAGAISQLETDSYRRSVDLVPTEEFRAQVQWFITEKLRGLIVCEAKSNCEPGDLNFTPSEPFAFPNPRASQRLDIWQWIRVAALALGSFLVIAGKWRDAGVGPPRKSAMA